MSHIAVAKVSTKVAMKDEELLKRAIQSIGKLRANTNLYKFDSTGTRLTRDFETFPLVLASREDDRYRVGFRREKDGNWYPHYDDFDDLGAWCRQAAAVVEDAYLAHYYRQELEREGFDVSVNVANDGTIEVLAEEETW